MEQRIKEFVIDALNKMNYDVTEVTGETELGPAGVDLESVAVAELALQVEDEFKVSFTEEDTERVALMTIDELAAEVSARVMAAASNA
jgi:acyl carrier protein